MLQSRFWGRGSGRCVPLVTLSQPDVGASAENAIPLQPMHACNPGQARGLREIKGNLRNLKWRRSRVRVGRGGPKCFLTSASPERTDQRQSFPRPNAHRICGSILHVCRHAKVQVWGYVREKVCTVQT